MMMKRILGIFLIVILLGVTTVGCNTIRGVGEDVEDAGEAVQDAAD